ncbi:MAG: hypothetical protein A3G18_03460 [Rhodospirillales bacterium RIFCSPLOWO2_12_FULL_58_28]|nr:MAG: hypothetical protein A3H92_01155 [Rhodospirillales bacterium RIFCSPLOWO2_02_FULL_58_16]OHC76826.1 MAG: hypothetical protein A3G18_03460 [Rhodospirillales bacterium RIFCSPLOWO2_12_FULL_58_28]
MKKITHEDKALIIDPFAAAVEYFNAGNRREAFSLFKEVLAIKPDDAQTLHYLGRIALQVGDGAGAAELFAAADYSLSIVLKKQGKRDEALAAYRRALAADPRCAARDDNRSIRLLGNGNLDEGWYEFEWRSTVTTYGPFADKIWNGEELSGKTILIWGEQGIGDQLMLAECLPDVINRAGHCLIEVDRRLVPLFARSFPKASIHGENKFTADAPVQWRDVEWTAPGSGPGVDYFAFLGSLPRFFRPTLNSFPNAAAFLAADRERTAFWRNRLGGTAGKRKVGVSWRSLHMTDEKAEKFPPLGCWRAVFAMPETTFVGLQVNMSDKERDEINERFGVDLKTWSDLDLLDDIDGTASLVSALDGVVSADTYLPMLAGGLGVPVWRVTRGRKENDWSHLGAEKYPWFTSMTVGFGVSENELNDVFKAIAGDITGR